MTVLLPFFSDIETNAADLDVATVERRQKIYDNIRSYNRLFSGIYLMIYDSERNFDLLMLNISLSIIITWIIRGATKYCWTYCRSANAPQTFMEIFLVRRRNWIDISLEDCDVSSNGSCLCTTSLWLTTRSSIWRTRYIWIQFWVHKLKQWSVSKSRDSYLSYYIISFQVS